MAEPVRILFINHPEADYGGGFLYAGLCSVLGPKAVYDYPVKWSYHGQAHNYSLPNIPEGHTAPAPWMPLDGYPVPYDTPEQDEDEVCRLLGSGYFSLVVLESLRPVALKSFAQLWNHISAARLNVVAHDGEDFSDIQKRELGKVNPKLLLKRELLAEEHAGPDVTVGGTRVLGWPFSCPDLLLDRFPTHKPKPYETDLVFLAGLTHPDRPAVAESLRSSGLLGRIGLDREGLLVGWDAYLNAMYRSRLAVSVRGFGIDTVRFWEAAACTTLLCDRRRLHYLFPFEHGKTCIEYHTTEQAGPVALDWVRNRPDEVRAIWSRARGYLRRHHTNSARARFLLTVVRDMGLLRNE